jgi:Flp pilus assembly protein TadG
VIGRLFRGLRADRRAGLALMVAWATIPLVGFTAVAVDGMRAWLVYSRLTAALDAAALAGARNIAVAAATRDNEVSSLFWANMTVKQPAPGQPAWTPATGLTQRWTSFLDSSVRLETLTAVDLLTFQVTASAQLPTSFAKLIGVNTFTMRASARAQRANTGLELALVLDITGSMDTNCTLPSNRTSTNCTITSVPRAPGQVISAVNNNADLMRVAAADLVNIVFGNNETQRNLYVSVVPFTTTVNLGPTRTAWLDATSRANLNANFSPTTWWGCVEARVGYAGAPTDGDRNDYTPSEVPFRPFYWPSTLGVYTRNGNRVPGDNDWARRLWNATTTGTDAITESWFSYRGNYQVGPNSGCPSTPVLPLSTSKTAVLDTIQSMRATNRGGTMGNLGLLAGWWTLSPRWRGTWNLGPAPDNQATSLPLAYNTPNMRKVIVMMTDGDQNWFDSPNGFPGDCTITSVNSNSFPNSGAGFAAPGPSMPVQPVACPSSSQTSSVVVAAGGPAISGNADYTGYGRLAERRLGSGIGTNAQATAELNNRLAALCTTIKNNGVMIYTMVVNTSGSVSTATRTLYQNCATAPANYYLVTTPDQLRPTFQLIANELTNLRIVQ